MLRTPSSTSPSQLSSISLQCLRQGARWPDAPAPDVVLARPGAAAGIRPRRWSRAGRCSSRRSRPPSQGQPVRSGILVAVLPHWSIIVGDRSRRSRRPGSRVPDRSRRRPGRHVALALPFALALPADVVVVPAAAPMGSRPGERADRTARMCARDQRSCRTSRAAAGPGQRLQSGRTSPHFYPRHRRYSQGQAKSTAAPAARVLHLATRRRPG